MDDSDLANDLPIEFDPDALREKYRQERDKRLRADADAQYIEAKGEFSHYNDDDPYVEPGFTRKPLTDEIDVAIIGGGFIGLMGGAHLCERGVRNVRIIEAAGDFGGTWYWNRYPGSQCDIESYIYLPLLEETGYMPKEKYSFAAEIYEHCQRTAKHYGLYENACFQTRVKAIVWDEAAKRWLIRTDRNDQMKARFVIMAAGVGCRTKLPGIPGIEGFKGHSFHTGRWDYGFTGGDANASRWDFQATGADATGRLDKLFDKKVALIGTGATALQCMPYLARDAQHVYVFQRTPSAVSLRGGNEPTCMNWVKTLQPGWQKERRYNFEEAMQGKAGKVDLVNDCWTNMFRNMRAALKPDMSPEELARQAELTDFRMTNQVREQISAIVKDKQVAEALKPWYRLGCKRPVYNDEYLAAFNRSNVTLVDVSASKGVERITKNGVMANGVEYEVDCIIFATGFQIAITDLKRGIGFDIIGRNGESLYDHWGNGLSTLHGHSTHGFPNWFYLGISQSGLGFNQGYMLNEQTGHIGYIISEAMKRRADVLEVTPEAEAQWVARIHSMAKINRAFLEARTPGFYNNEGAVRGGGLLAEIFAPGLNAFNELLAQWREEGNLEGFQLTESPHT